MEETKKAIASLGNTYEEFKIANDERLKKLEAKGTVDPLLTEKVEKINADVTELSKMKAELDLLAKEVAQAKTLPGGGDSEVNGARAEHKDAFEKWFRSGGEANLANVKQLQVKAGLSTLSDPDGGYIIAPPEFDKAIDRVAGTISVMRNLATVRAIGVDTYKKLVNMGGASSGWVAERESRPETATPTLREIAINQKELYAEPGATNVALDDAYMDLASWLADEVSVEFSEQEGSAFVNGDGVAKPHGIAGYTMVTNASYEWGKVGYVPGGNATVLNSPDALVNLQHALKPVYRNGATWLLNDATCAKIRTLKTGEGEYLWQPGLVANAPDMLLGKPVAYDDNIADIAGNAFPVFFGNFKRAYLILDRTGIRILRDPYTSKGNTLFYTTKRVGGGIVMFEAVKALKIATT